ncbi:hypothetical protein KLQU111869_15790 [Klebsiella quasipneumoniae subsp. similipneumoniae]|nr:hypothetical protein AI2622V1_5334 [Klebsiella pneumoniae]CAH5067796.1 hypothetical protein AI2622V1_5334 [Klebsiella pneumoniae]VGP84151.1 hypothetical protein SB00610_04081 [Klebsiella quasipneumoniae subsp. similipneumoniae]
MKVVIIVIQKSKLLLILKMNIYQNYLASNV